MARFTSSRNPIEELQHVQTVLKADPHGVTDRRLVFALSPTMFPGVEEYEQIKISKHVIEIIPQVMNSDVLYRVYRLWLMAHDMNQASIGVTVKVLEAIASNPHLSDQTALLLLDTPFNEVRSALQANTGLSGRVRVLSAV